MRAGRKRKLGVKRTPSGAISRAKDGIHPETLAVRERELARDGIILEFRKLESGREVWKRTAEDRLSGYTLGKLLLRHRQDKTKGITQQQFDLGEAWGSLAMTRKSIDDSRRLSAKSASFVMVAGGVSNVEMNDERAGRIKSKWDDCNKAIDRKFPRSAWKVRQVLYGVCVENWPLAQVSESDLELLRTGLDTVGEALG
jgi:hypothetical protein